MRCPRRILAALVMVLAIAAGETTRAAVLLSDDAIARLGAQRYWELALTMDPAEAVTRTVLVDDNLYVFTNVNRVVAVHAMTGIVRWSRIIADPGQTVRGPSHNDTYAFFTTGGSVTVLDRRTGEAASHRRTLRGVVIQVLHDTAIVSIGADHGVKGDDVFRVYRLNEVGEETGEAIAELRLESVQARTSRGHLTRLISTEKTRSGDRVQAEIHLPLDRVKLPFAASCAAVADEHRIYVGAANQRFYSLDIIQGFQHWQLMTPNTVSGTPIVDRTNLYFGGQDGRAVSCTKSDRRANWIFETDGPIFADLLVAPEHVYVPSSDRSLYCLERATGRRIWRQRFDDPLMRKPDLSDGRLYQQAGDQGLFVLSAENGEQLWHRPEGGRFLAQFEKDSYLLVGGDMPQIVRVNAATGEIKDVVGAYDVLFGVPVHAEQAIVLCGPRGDLVCLRSQSAPRLKPAAIAEVLRDDEKMKIAARIEADQKARLAARQAPEPPKEEDDLAWLYEDDWLSSRSTATPVGGRGLVSLPGEAAPKPSAGKPVVNDAAAGDEDDEPAPDEEDSAPSDEDSEEPTSDEEESEDEAEAEEESDEEKAGADDESADEEEDTGDESDEEETSEEEEEDEESGTDDEESDPEGEDE